MSACLDGVDCFVSMEKASISEVYSLTKPLTSPSSIDVFITQNMKIKNFFLNFNFKVTGVECTCGEIVVNFTPFRNTN